MLSTPRLSALLALSTALAGAPALAEMNRSLNLNGTTGLIDMPSGDAQDDATFSFSIGNIGPITRTTLSFQATERLSASFRFQAWRDWDAVIPGDEKETDRSIDLRYQILSGGLFTDEKAAVIDLYAQAARQAQAQGERLASDPAVIALCEKKLTEFLRDFLAKQPGVVAVPHIRIAYTDAG